LARCNRLMNRVDDSGWTRNFRTALEQSGIEMTI
jgi:hypothetical protein